MNQEHAFALADREAPRPRVPHPRPADPRALQRNRPSAVAHPQRHDAGDGRRCADATAVGLRRAREAHGVLRTRLGIAHACGLCPPGRRAPGSAASQLLDDIVGVLRCIFRAGDSTISRASSRTTASSSSAMSTSAYVSLEDASPGAFPVSWCAGPAAAWDLRKCAALRMLQRTGFRHSDRQERRLLRPLSDPHGRDACQSTKIMQAMLLKSLPRVRAAVLFHNDGQQGRAAEAW